MTCTALINITSNGMSEAIKVTGGMPLDQARGLLGSAVQLSTPKNMKCIVPNAKANHTTGPNTNMNCDLFMARPTEGRDASPVMMNKDVLRIAVNFDA